jgi:hypothetical protein
MSVVPFALRVAAAVIHYGLRPPQPSPSWPVQPITPWAKHASPGRDRVSGNITVRDEVGRHLDCLHALLEQARWAAKLSGFDLACLIRRVRGREGSFVQFPTDEEMDRKIFGAWPGRQCGLSTRDRSVKGAAIMVVVTRGWSYPRRQDGRRRADTGRKHELPFSRACFVERRTALHNQRPSS